MSTCSPLYFFFFFFNDTATTEIYTLSLHDALPICIGQVLVRLLAPIMSFTTEEVWQFMPSLGEKPDSVHLALFRSEEHTSELQSPCNLVCRLLLEKKKKKKEY